MSLNQENEFFISAGEQSGDQIAAELITQLKIILPKWEVFGICGASMKKAGAESILDMESLSLMGIGDVIRQIGDLRVLESKILAHIDRRKPKFAVLVDFPALHFRLAEQLKLRGVFVIQYVAPKLWAWGMNRVEALKRDFDLVLGILPFEQEFFSSRGVNYKYCGSPSLERLMEISVSKESFGLDSEKKILALLPGSRRSELKFNLPLLKELAESIHREDSRIEFVVPIATALNFQDVMKALGIQDDDSTAMEKSYQEWGAGLIPSWKYGVLRFIRGMSLELMKIADAAVVCSGTATLECAILNTPMVVIYKTDQTTYDYARTIIQVPYISLVNLIQNEEIVPEFIQEIDLDALKLFCWSLLFDAELVKKQRENFSQIRSKLSMNAARNAAIEIADLIGMSNI